MKKNFIRIIILIAIIWLIFFIKDIPKYRFGYFVEGPEFKYSHGNINQNVFKLNNGNIFILGENDDGVSVPSEMYDVKTNKVKEIVLPKNFYYWDNGLLLNDNKILITHSYNPSDSRYKSRKAYPYDSMIILNLDTLKFEKSIEKKINKTYEPVRCFNIMSATLLSKKKVFMYQDGKVEIYDIDKNTSELKNISLGKFLNVDQIFLTKKNEILLFGGNNLSKDEDRKVKYGDLDYVYKYDYKSNTIKTAGRVIRREHPRRVKIDNSRIIIFGGKAVLPYDDSKYKEMTKLKEIEIYNIDTEKSEIVANLLEPRCYEFMGSGGLNGAKLGDKHFLITGGKCFFEPMFGIKSKTSPKDSEILDLDTYKIKLGPKAKDDLAGYSMITLNDGNIFISLSARAGYNRGIQLFKQWRMNKWL